MHSFSYPHLNNIYRRNPRFSVRVLGSIFSIFSKSRTVNKEAMERGGAKRGDRVAAKAAESSESRSVRVHDCAARYAACARRCYGQRARIAATIKLSGAQRRR